MRLRLRLSSSESTVGRIDHSRLNPVVVDRLVGGEDHVVTEARRHLHLGDGDWQGVGALHGDDRHRMRGDRHSDGETRRGSDDAQPIAQALRHGNDGERLVGIAIARELRRRTACGGSDDRSRYVETGVGRRASGGTARGAALSIDERVWAIANGEVAVTIDASAIGLGGRDELGRRLVVPILHEQHTLIVVERRRRVGSIAAHDQGADETIADESRHMSVIEMSAWLVEMEAIGEALRWHDWILRDSGGAVHVRSI